MNKLQRVRRLESPADLFADMAEKRVDAWRALTGDDQPETDPYGDDAVVPCAY